MKKSLFLVGLCSLLFSGSAMAAEPQLYPKDQLKTWNRDNVAKGQGTLFGQFAYTRNDATKDMVIKEIGWMTLKPGDSIGMHKHENNEDSYIIVSGEGVFTDTAGKETPVKAGDVTIARPGDAHALKNTGKEPLIFLDIIAQR
ncbi:MAG: cupin domain-containing protein [Desulfovibrio sp.]|nr:cupin domain-containing protein [Desulfovibrio sp.]